MIDWAHFQALKKIQQVTRPIGRKAVPIAILKSASNVRQSGRIIGQKEEREKRLWKGAIPKGDGEPERSQKSVWKLSITREKWAKKSNPKLWKLVLLRRCDEGERLEFFGIKNLLAINPGLNSNKSFTLRASKSWPLISAPNEAVCSLLKHWYH